MLVGRNTMINNIFLLNAFILEKKRTKEHIEKWDVRVQEVLLWERIKQTSYNFV